MNPSNTQEEEAGGLRVSVQPGIYDMTLFDNRIKTTKAKNENNTK
jgi:hypothetical protein